ncbi:MAG: hypothetical protein VX642_08285 [Bdellovibrionota bacterium]|nr:hypothetical protein [Bdellovibrionota bacterium]
MKRPLYLTVFLFLLSACSTYHMQVQKSVEEMRGGNFEAASSFIKERAFLESGDQVAYLLDYALLEHYAGNFEESNHAFHLAEELTEIKDYISLSDEASSMVFSESMVAYKGDDYEKILINIFKAINYVALNEDEAALVEIRKLNDKLNAYRNQAGREYSDNPLAHYLAAILWEKQKSWDDSCIEYEKFYELSPNFPGIGDDLIFCSFVSQRWEKHRKWKKLFRVDNYSAKQAKERKKQKDILYISYQGMGPVKVPNPAWPRLPMLVPRDSIHTYESAYALGKSNLASRTILNIDKLAIDAFEEQFGKLLAKRIAARVAKDQIRQKIKEDDQGAAFLAMIIMDVTDQADLRQWTMLPKLIQLSKVPLNHSENKLVNIQTRREVIELHSSTKKIKAFTNPSSVNLQPTNQKLQIVLSKDQYLVFPKLLRSSEMTLEPASLDEK